MPLSLKSTDRVTLAGLPGTGKTTLMRYLASLTMPDILIYDPLDQYQGFAEEMRYIPTNDSAQEFDGVCARVRARGNMTLFVEECERYIGQGKPMLDNAFDLVNRGRNWGVGIVANTRRIQRMDKDFFDLCHHIFFFKCGLRSRNYVEDLIGKDAARKVMSLDLFQFMHYDLQAESYQVMSLKLPTREVKSDGPMGGGVKVESGGAASQDDDAEPPQAAAPVRQR